MDLAKDPLSIEGEFRAHSPKPIYLDLTAGHPPMSHDPISHPTHYIMGGIETLDFIKAKLTPEEFKGYIKGNCIKYIVREGMKNGLEDFEKAEFYLNDYIAYAKKQEKEK